ncbi:LOW QUALITY PROTEIN: hypothetical protein OSB04_010290 [Centaurea solstitialis]|uniref:Uncharacterized protein n=1 Tax=Centaurea solstitialis TaxID=347529 RepID=A0AA38TKG6_9ASTR|nr:LOW QUALITY PROTEIN: hypothetical protein OSB04_010290 [Centaurea solstitialis]
MPRSSRTGSPTPINLEIERTAKWLRKQAKLRKKLGEGSLSSGEDINLSSDSDEEKQKEKQKEEEEKPKVEMAKDEQTLRQLATQDVAQTPICIRYPTGNQNFALKTGLVHLLPTYHGLENEDPNKHLKQFHIVCLSMKPAEVSEDLIKLKAFPFSLKDRATDWLYSLPPNSVETWNQMARLFLDKFFPASRAAILRREICSIKQRDVETLHEYWERFKHLCVSCPQHGISEQLLLQYFYEGLLPMDRKMIDAASGGAMFNKTPTEVRALITTMAENSQHFSVRSDMRREPTKTNEVNVASIESRLFDLTNMVKQLVVDKEQVKACGICLSTGHPTDACPQLQEDVLVTAEDVNAIGGFQGQQQRFFNNNFGNQRPPQFQNFVPRPPQQQFQQRAPFNPNQATSSSQGMSLEEIVKNLATNTLQFQQKTEASLQNLGAQMTQLATSVSRLESQGKLPSQAETNPKQNVSAIVLRSGKELEEPKMVKSREMEKEKEVSPKPIQDEKPSGSTDEVSEKAKVIPPPFPTRFQMSNKAREEKEILDTFRKVEQIPRYAKFLKKLCTNKRKLRGNQTISMSENVSVVFQKKLPPKCKDPGVFTIPCKLGNVTINRAMLDLGASINVMPYSIFKILNVGSLQETGVIIQLADRSLIHLKGVLEDLLVQLNELVFPANFYVIDMEEDSHPKSTSILEALLKTAKTKIDVHKGTLSMEFDGNVIHFNIYESMRFPSDVSSLCSIDIIEPISQELLELTHFDALDTILSRSLDEARVTKLMKEIELGREFHKLAPKLELKTLPEHLKYVYLEEGENLPVIISSRLDTSEEKKLVSVLKRYKEAIGWTIADIKGLSPSTCMHKILMEDDFKPFHEAQRRLNPPMMEMLERLAGHVISSKGIEVDRSKVDVIKAYPTPLRRFIKDFSHITRPMCNLLQKDVEFKFDEKCKEAFDRLKEMLTSAPIMKPPNWDLPFEIMCDASNYAIGAVLGQRVGRDPHVIYYASRTLDSAQANYSTTEKELLAVVFALEKFRQYLLDHAALRYLMTKKDAKPRLIRWILLLQEFDLEIRDKSGAQNLVADHLSRIVSNEEPLPLDDKFPNEHLFEVKTTIPWYADIVNYLVTGTTPKELPRSKRDKIKSDSKYYMWDDPYLWKQGSDQIIRRCVSDDEVTSILEFCHSYACGGHLDQQGQLVRFSRVTSLATYSSRHIHVL